MLRKLEKNNDAFVITATFVIVLIAVLGGFIFMGFLITQLVNIGYAMILMGVAVIAMAAGVMILRKALSGLGLGKKLNLRGGK